MGILTKIKQIAEAACPAYTFAYDIRQMQNVDADYDRFPMIFVDEYYAGRVYNQYGWHREVTLEIHFLNLVPMHGEAEEREAVREQMYTGGVMPLLKALNEDGTFGEITEVQCDPEPPMFDANATGLLLRATLNYPNCAL